MDIDLLASCTFGGRQSDGPSTCQTSLQETRQKVNAPHARGYFVAVTMAYPQPRLAHNHIGQNNQGKKASAHNHEKTLAVTITTNGIL